MAFDEIEGLFGKSLHEELRSVSTLMFIAPLIVESPRANPV
jgi:hypothetical protein